MSLFDALNGLVGVDDRFDHIVEALSSLNFPDGVVVKEQFLRELKFTNLLYVTGNELNQSVASNRKLRAYLPLFAVRRMNVTDVVVALAKLEEVLRRQQQAALSKDAESFEFFLGEQKKLLGSVEQKSSKFSERLRAFFG
jgi:hypothetical protein